jgi:hypothetical protein
MSTNNTLRSIGSKYGTDKVSHGFCEVYEEKFNNIRESSKNILEIGVFFGASILMWRDYFSNSTIHGFDTFEGLQGNGHRFQNSDKFLNEWKNDVNLQNRIELYKYDQGKESDLISFISDIKKKNISFDVIIEDGSHLMVDQQLDLKYLFSTVKSGGYYVIEDIHSSLGAYDVMSDFSNTTLTMINRYKEKKELHSIYVDLSDIKPLIKNMELFTVESTGSMTCIIEKI